MNRRLGRFSIAEKMVEDAPHHVKAVMARCIVVRCEMRWTGTLEYVAISDHFDIVQKGERIPLYVVTFDAVGGVEFLRKHEE